MDALPAGNEWRLVNVTLVLPDRLVEGGSLHVRQGRIAAVGPAPEFPPFSGVTVDAAGKYAAPGFVDLHVHGGGGADFMDGSDEAFEAALRAHCRHGTTSIVPTSTVARHEQTMQFLRNCRAFKRRGAQGGADAARGLPRVVG